MRTTSCWDNHGETYLFVGLRRGGLKLRVSIEHSANEKQDIPCLEDVGVGELEDEDVHTREQRLGYFAPVCFRWRHRIRFSGLGGTV